jgi:amino acid transporter
MGWDNASTIAQEVENPQRTYPHAMLVSAIVVTCVYTLPLLAVWMVGIPAERFSTGAWVDAAMVLGGPALALGVVLAGSLDGLGTFNALTLSLTRLPYAMAEDGLLPKVLTRRLSNGVPWVSVLACSLGWALALGFTFERLISIDLVLYGGALLLEFIALVVLRVKEPKLHRPFRVPGGTWVAVAMGTGPVLLIGFALWAARGEQVAGLPALWFAAIVAAGGPIAYLLARRRRTVTA